MIKNRITAITEKIIGGDKDSLSLEEACDLASLSGECTIDLITSANKIREQYKKNRIFRCSIISAKSGLCPENCSFCAQSGHHKTGIKIYPLLGVDEMVDTALEMSTAGATQYSFVTSGYEVTDDDIEKICDAAKVIQDKTDLKLCASLGMLTEEKGRKLADSGFIRYHHNLETARSHFKNVCTSHEYDEDIETIRIAREAGLEVCCGFIMGLGESWDQRMELAFTIRELEVESIPINFLNPIPGTKLEASPLVAPMDALKCIALFRLVNPEKDISICGGREITLRDYQSWVFLSGANGIMIGNYLTTAGRNMEDDINIIHEMGLEM